MSEDQTKNTAPSNLDDIKAKLDTEIKSAQNNLVSEEVQRAIQAEKEKAKEEARVSFEKDQLAKDQEKKIKDMEEAAAQKERQTAESLEALKKQMDDLKSTKAVLPPSDNPLNNDSGQNDVKNMSKTDMDKIEQESFRRFLAEKSMRN